MSVTITTAVKTFTLKQGETLLDGLRRTGHEVNFQCREGYCGSCRVKLVAGVVDYATPPLAHVAADEVLSCCCVAKTDLQVECQQHRTQNSTAKQNTPKHITKPSDTPQKLAPLTQQYWQSPLSA